VEVVKSINDEQLRELEERIADLSRRHLEQQAALASIRQRLQQASEDDLNRKAAALSNGTDKPRPKAPGVARALEQAEHDAAVMERALEMATTERARYYAENADALAAKLEEAKAAKAQEVSKLAALVLASLREFFQVDEDAKLLKPYRQPPAESNDKARDMFTILGTPLTTANAFGSDKVAGLHRGELEAVLANLANLPAAFPRRDPGEERADVA
jgi:hypothetical protein